MTALCQQGSGRAHARSARESEARSEKRACRLIWWGEPPERCANIREAIGIRLAKDTARPYARRAVVQRWVTARRVYRANS